MARMPNTKQSVGYIPAPSAVEELMDWGMQPNAVAGNSASSGLLLYKSDDEVIESGLWVCTPGKWTLEIPGDEICYFVSGQCTYHSNSGEMTEVSAGSVVHFESGWSGECTVHQTIRNTYMLVGRTSADEKPQAHLLQDPMSIIEVKDWGPIPTMIEGESHTSGVLLHRRPSGESETGVWICTPGYWNCHVTSDEYCHFIEGNCTYVHETGEVIEIEPDTLAFFPKDWRGTCRIAQTVRKVYMIRGVSV